MPKPQKRGLFGTIGNTIKKTFLYMFLLAAGLVLLLIGLVAGLTEILN